MKSEGDDLVVYSGTHATRYHEPATDDDGQPIAEPACRLARQKADSDWRLISRSKMGYREGCQYDGCYGEFSPRENGKRGGPQLAAQIQKLGMNLSDDDWQEKLNAARASGGDGA